MVGKDVHQLDFSLKRLNDRWILNSCLGLTAKLPGRFLGAWLFPAGLEGRMRPH